MLTYQIVMKLVAGEYADHLMQVCASSMSFHSEAPPLFCGSFMERNERSCRNLFAPDPDGVMCEGDSRARGKEGFFIIPHSHRLTIRRRVFLSTNAASLPSHKYESKLDSHLYKSPPNVNNVNEEIRSYDSADFSAIYFNIPWPVL